MKEIDIISRLGKKTQDIKYFDKYLITDDINIIVEPFAGSFAVSKYYVKNGYHNIIHINDNDDELYYIYHHYKDYIKLRNAIQIKLVRWIDKKIYTKDQISIIKKMKYNEHLINYYIKNSIIHGHIHHLTKSTSYNQYEQLILVGWKEDSFKISWSSELSPEEVYVNLSLALDRLMNKMYEF